MKVLITGGAGFIGSHIVDQFVDAGHDVIVVDHETDVQKRNENPKAEYFIADMVAPKTLQWIEEEKPNVICHLAAQISVSKSVADPHFDRLENFEKPKILVQKAIESGVNVFINTSSCAVYGDAKELPLKESGPANPCSPYGQNKLDFERYVLGLDGIRTVSFRPANVYGPRQTTAGEAGVVAIFIEKFLQNDEVIIYGDGQATRDFIFVEDVSAAFLLAAENNIHGSFNLGTGISTSINQLWQSICDLDAEKKKKIKHSEPRKGDILHSVLDVQKAKAIRWKSKGMLKDGLVQTYAWLKED